jgi:hypothetical protein
MRKRLISHGPRDVTTTGRVWLDLERLAQVDVTSEAAGYPIESALVPGAATGWRAGQSGEQTIRLLFDEPTRVRRIVLSFREEERGRTQEFVLRWSPDGGQSYREIVRQQYNFSPPGTTRETEEYTVELDRVTALELRIIPDIGGGAAVASIEQLRLA